MTASAVVDGQDYAIDIPPPRLRRLSKEKDGNSLPKEKDGNSLVKHCVGKLNLCLLDGFNQGQGYRSAFLTEYNTWCHLGAECHSDYLGFDLLAHWNALGYNFWG